MFAVEIDQVSKRFGRLAAVANLSLQVPAGSIYGFIGPNGSGKTTTLRMIMRILHPDNGSIRVLASANAPQAASGRVFSPRRPPRPAQREQKTAAASTRNRRPRSRPLSDKE